MSITLEVDTDEIRHASSALRRAAESQRQPATLPEVIDVADALHRAECHGSAIIREALRSAIRRAECGFEAARRLTDVSSAAASALDLSAADFDRIEQQLAAEN